MGTGPTLGFFDTMIWNTKQRNFTEDKKMRIAHDLYIYTIYHIVCIHVYPPPPLENFIGEIRGSDCPDDQTNTPNIWQNPLPVYHYISEPPPWEFVEEEEKIPEQKIIFEDDGD